MIFFIVSMMIMSHPLSIIIYILLMSMIFLSMMVFYIKSSWFSLIFMLMMLGGLMVLFIYMASLSSNEYFKFKKYWEFGLMFLFLFSPIISINYNLSEFMLVKMFNNLSLFMFLLYIIYLFLVLVLIIEMLVSIKSSLRLEM
uniref:NADH dehydrogenase subunit 6 n=1 Tax=Laelaps chini TaxID=2902761 RepID=A0AAU6QDI8_9ACAR